MGHGNRERKKKVALGASDAHGGDASGKIKVKRGKKGRKGRCAVTNTHRERTVHTMGSPKLHLIVQCCNKDVWCYYDMGM